LSSPMTFHKWKRRSVSRFRAPFGDKFPDRQNAPVGMCLALGLKEEKINLHVYEDPSDPHKIKWRLLAALGQFCHIEAWRKGGAKNGHYEFLGADSDMEWALWLLDHLTAQVTEWLADHLCSSLAPPSERRRVIRDFVIGATSTLSEAMIITVNFILKWVRGEVGALKLDENLSEISLITKDAFEPTLPLSVVMHIDHQKAPMIIQRSGTRSGAPPRCRSTA
jgi:hypothetical protein